MSTATKYYLIGISVLTIGVCHPVSAQAPFPTPDLQSACALPGSQWNPLCNGRQATSGRQDNGERSDNGVTYNIGPIGPIERATLPPNADSIIALVPDALVQAAASQNLPPMWMRVCRTNTAPGGQNMFVKADGEKFILVYPRCTYVAFRRGVSIGTTSSDQATTEYQMLGRY